MDLIQKEMDKRYWDGMAGKYENEIFSVLHSDKKAIIQARLRKIASLKKSVADIGCGIGHFLPTLSILFFQVYANDISEELLAQAKEAHKKLTNVHFIAGDIRSAVKNIPRVDCVVSVNSLISSSVTIRRKMLRAISDILKPGGDFILVVPSLESSLFVDVRFAHWKWNEGMDPVKALRSVYPKRAEDDNKARQGILPIDGVATKHFLSEEIHLLLDEVELDVSEIAKIEYGWETEFEAPPRWMQEPYPWDWLVMAKKRKA